MARSTSKQKHRPKGPERLAQLRKRLAKAIVAPQCELDHDSPWQLLCATILAAQSNDRTINKITPQLFRRWPTPAALADADRDGVEAVVKASGFFRNKARAIQEASRIIATEHGGEVPADLDALVALPGVARKTANVVLGVAMGIASGIVVDTHCSRVAQRLELTSETDPVKIERDLCALIPRRSWIDTSHRLVLHGRYVCGARAPRCEHCALNELCGSSQRDPEGPWNVRARWEDDLVRSRGTPAR